MIKPQRWLSLCSRMVCSTTRCPGGNRLRASFWLAFHWNAPVLISSVIFSIIGSGSRIYVQSFHLVFFVGKQVFSLNAKMQYRQTESSFLYIHAGLALLMTHKMIF
ncbi:MAG: hypothetical protein ACLUGO_06115, partial [Mediterraneibacter faecis]